MKIDYYSHDSINGHPQAECDRCGAIIRRDMRDKHTAWHASTEIDWNDGK